MVGKEKHDDIKLTDVVDIKFLQELQDNFAKAMGVASITVDLEGPVTKPSNFTDFCMKHTRGSELGYKRCNECDIHWGDIAASQGHEVIYDCHSCLTDFAVPIVVNNKQIGTILGGQVLTKEPDEQHFRALAKELGIDEQEYLNAIKQVKIMPKEQVKATAKILFLIANSISELAYKNLELKQKNKKESTFRKITEIIIKSEFDSQRLKEQLVKIIGEYFNADRCYFVEVDTQKHKNQPISPNEEFLASDDVKSIIGYKFELETVQTFVKRCMELKDVVSFDYESINQENTEGYAPLLEYANAFGLKSGIGLPFFEQGELTSVLVIEYAKEIFLPKEDDIDFLKVLGSQLGVLFNQIKLYETVNLTAKREALLRRINETISSTLEMDTILSFICKEVTELFNIQRLVIVEFPYENNYSDYFIKKEYKTRENIKSVREIDPRGLASKYWGERLSGGDSVIAIDNISESDAPEHFKSAYEQLGVKSGIGAVVKKDGKIWGEIVLLDYDKYRHWHNEEIALLSAIADQVYISIQQSELYLKTKQQMEREMLLRKIIETISSTLDIDKILSFICTEVAKLFNVQRTVIVEFYNPEDYSQYDIRSEYRARQDIKSIRDTSSYQQTAAYWGKTLLTGSDLLIFDNIEESNAPDYFKDLYKRIGVKSGIGVIVRKDSKKWDAILLFEYDNYRHWTDDEQNLLSAIANQIHISMKQSELYLKTKQQMEREKAIINNLPFLAWLKDQNGNFLAVNELFAKQCSMTPEEIVGKNDFDIYPEYLARKYFEDDKTIMETGEQMQTEEGIEGPDGISWFETFKRPVLDERGIVIGTTGFARDITEQKEVDKMKNEFVSIISHELRTPLTSIRGALGLVSSNTLGQLPDQVNTLLNIASNNTIRLINLINDILDLEKIKAGKMDFNYAEYEIMPLIEETVKLNEEYARQYNVRFEISKHLDNALINVDKDRLIQVLTNLFSNAAKFSYQNEPIIIDVERKKSLITVSITNKGHGIPEESFSKIFQSFSQVDSSDSRQKGGTGLGLSISKSIVEKMGGSVGFTSKLNESTTFYFELPEMHKDEETKTVLICDDNKTTAYCIKSMFESIGYATDIALCANEAETLLKEKNYDLMTLDLMLPDKPGLTFLEELKYNEKTKDLPVLIISVKKPEEEIIKQNTQVVDWLEKSFNTNDLQSTIEKIMSKKNSYKINILHVENDTDILKLINLTLRDCANITSAKGITEANKLLDEKDFDIIILDYVFPEGTSDKLIPTIRSGRNKEAKVILFSAYEESKILSRYVDLIVLKTNLSNEEFKESIQKFIDIKMSEKQMIKGE